AGARLCSKHPHLFVSLFANIQFPWNDYCFCDCPDRSVFRNRRTSLPTLPLQWTAASLDYLFRCRIGSADKRRSSHTGRELFLVNLCLVVRDIFIELPLWQSDRIAALPLFH